jgi:putative transposase
MVRGQRKQYSGNIKARAVLEAIRGERTANEIGSDLGVHPTQITKWKKQALAELPQLFSRRRETAMQDEEDLKARLYQEIGQLKVELDWLKKKLWDGGSLKSGR